MLRAALLALTLAFAAAPAPAQEGDAGIETVIQSQIDAFLQDDFATAFTFASPNIKRLFGTPERFGMMVRQGYPMVWRPAEVQFLELRRMGGRNVQTVMITDGAGAVHVLAYEMIQTGEGWQINGVSILRQPGLGA